MRSVGSELNSKPNVSYDTNVDYDGRFKRSRPLTVHSRFPLTTRVREGTSCKSHPTRSVVRDICFPCAPWSTTSMRVCRVVVPASVDENVSYDVRPVLRHPNKTGKLTMLSTGTEMASFSSRSHSIRLSRPCESSVMPINRTLRK
jgi:hypothetical protein